MVSWSNFWGAYFLQMGRNKPPTTSRWRFWWPTFLWNIFSGSPAGATTGALREPLLKPVMRWRAGHCVGIMTDKWWWLPGGWNTQNATKIPTKNPGYGWVIKWIGCILMYIFYIYLTFDTHTYLYINMKICCRHRYIPITWALTEVWAIVETVGSVYYDINATKTQQNSSLKPLRISSINSMLWKVVVGGLLYL